MKRNPFTICLVVGLLVGGGVGAAAEPPAWFKAADKNGDGKLSREEAPNKAVFGDVDTDGDGFASLAEVNAWLAKQPKPATPHPSVNPQPQARNANDPQPQAKPRDGAAATGPSNDTLASGSGLNDVEKRPVVIFSDGTRMAGDLYLPKNRKPDEKFPAIVLCAGTGGTKGGTQARIAPIFARNGFVVLAFDYRGWGDSESQLMAVEPQPKPDANNEMTIKVKALRWQMNYTDQTEDIRAAISFVAGEPNVDKNRIGLWGSSYGGGLVTTMAALDSRVKCVAAQVPGMGGRAPRAVAAALDLHTKQARGEIEPVPIETGKMTGKMERYTNMRVNPAKSVGFSAVEAAERITSPIIFIVAENEELSSNDNVEAVHKSLTGRGVPSAYHVIKGITHYGIYREGFDEATKLELAFFQKHLSFNPQPQARTASDPQPKARKASDPQPQARMSSPQYDGLPSPSNEPTDKDVRRTEPAQLAYFEKKIRPVLVAQCYQCHSTDAKEIKGGLALDSREGIRKGGDSGPAVVPGDVSASLLIAAIRHEDGLAMPPKSKLTDEQIADFVKWIEAGAIDPRESRPGRKTAGVDIEAGRQFWAFQRPVKTPPPQVKNESWPLTDIDRFIRAAQEREGVEVVGDAEPRTLVRRLYFDLIGLPPTAEELDHWTNRLSFNPQPQARNANDPQPQARTSETQPRQTNSLAFGCGLNEEGVAALVDRLLESRHFGERWGRHWLDVARYAESSGKETSFSYPQAWRYRDYVIESVNADMPFDRFIREQIAGDLLPAKDDIQRAQQLVATGFLAIGPKSHIERNKKQFEMDLVDEQIDAVSQAFLGLTVACARCHDHKFDPIPQTDYYALAGIFRSTETLYGTIPVIQNNNPSQLLPLPEGAAMPAGVPTMTAAERERLEKQIAGLRAERQEMVRRKEFATSKFVQGGILLNTLEGKLKSYEADGTPKRLAMGVRDRAVAKDSELFIRGEVEKPGPIVPRGFVQVLCSADRRLSLRESTPVRGANGDDRGSGRLELADWIASADNPLTARVIVNRVWLNLFGRGLVPTPDNFGVSGQPPSHPELLDHLAVTFVEDGWSIKELIRRIALSRVYRLDSSWVESNFEKDPENVWLWRMSPRRLDAEAIRDAMLLTAGKLDLKPPVGSVVATGGEGYTGGVERGNQLAESKFNCRSVYLPVIRGRAFESLDLFDGLDGSMVTGQRDQTTVPSQSLYLLNSPYVLGLASAAAQRLIEDAEDPAGRIDLAYLRSFGRLPTDTERNAALAFIDSYRQQAAAQKLPNTTPEFTAWLTFCQSLWASGEFLVRK
jgi:cephalosporin-C deacetylase-like acetyl esterase